ncbi:MAG: MBL fold metallo-hydrolase [Acidobacteria bacterium]|nr:MBL fold metallo-hydrolase [Acidobacteriota bacterium]
MKIGPYRIVSLETGRFGLDGGAMFGVVPKTLWSRTNPSDERNRIPLAMRALLILDQKRKILVDVGCGHKFSGKLKEIYRLDHSRYTLPGSLAANGIEPEDITDVILTHFHFDHAGGATCYRNDRLELTFPSARHYIQQRQWERALNPSEKDRGSYMPMDIEPFRDHPQLTILDGPCELFPGLHLLISNGHTPGLQMVKIQDGDTTLFYCGDMMPTASHLPLPYLMGYDLYPLTTIEEKRRYLPQACEENWIIALEHDPVEQAIRIQPGRKYFEVCESVKF